MSKHPETMGENQFKTRRRLREGSGSGASTCSVQPMGFDLQSYIARAEGEEKKRIIADQWSQAVSQNTITCACGLERALPLAYRCLYCGQYYCHRCAEVHFSKTLAEWVAEKRTERRERFLSQND